MKIDNPNVTSASVTQSGGRPQTQAVERGASAATEDARQLSRVRDHVERSDFASRVSQALKANASRRTEKVNALAAEYQAGAYTVDSMAVSQKLVEASLTPGMDR